MVNIQLILDGNKDSYIGKNNDVLILCYVILYKRYY